MRQQKNGAGKEKEKKKWLFPPGLSEYDKRGDYKNFFVEQSVSLGEKGTRGEG